MYKTALNEDELVKLLTGVTYTALARRLLKNFKKAGLQITIEQWAILDVLWRADGLTQQELASQSFRDKPSITRLIDNLEKLNLVVRIPDKFDKRVNRIFLTHKGQILQNKTKQQAEKTMDEALVNITPDQLALCNQVLTTIFKNLAE
ncbi:MULTISPECIES: MarR family winged helix-turn-helix transcriptional regulator [Olivibacter]|jgi:DNA-binding MarR family transcriptional regulator|uniref:Transcriptional regulator, MarR family n=3 Tax=Sphingobacteriaceae TaxID=84566 RepID=F4C5M7_SPHS2|nr:MULTISPECIES: MarR family transcriptional regulator [Olivibacter]MCL4637437.1 MarR family transcriptional regulator [Olivibacter sp. UJ_SKK_5.1]MDM8175152.1 MarR family transcriptional regulator [Olivibacter sp. 47]MDX3913171.1 MarR family transcriptional regulator [Pseudosphingobacterium sp.]QEL01923.1 MarR family transcriptional regulator [Olivibacter sp. LS-1]